MKGWEEIVSASVTNMLKLAVTKTSSKDQTNLQMQPLKLPQDSSKLDKQLKSFISKLQGGAMLITNVYKMEATETAEIMNVGSNNNNSSNVDEWESEKSGGRAKVAPQVKSRQGKTTTTTTMASYGDDEDTTSNQQFKNQQEQTKKAFGESDLPSFEELMQSQEFKGKNQFNFDDDDD